MSVALDLVERQDRPAYVRFERRPVEDKVESLKQSKYVAKDVDYALISPPYSRDVIVQKVTSWLAQLDLDVNMERLPAAWRDAYKEGYRKWQNGQEMPLNGTPIRGWGVISPAQQENLIRMNILTVEDMARVNDEGAKRIGLGWLDLKNKADAWLRTLEERGPLTMENAQLKRDNDNLKVENRALTQKVEQLSAQLLAVGQMLPAPVAASVTDNTITADDILPESDEPRRKRK